MGTVANVDFRPFTGDSDIPAMVNLLNACFAADRLDDYVTVEGLTNWYHHLVNCDPREDVRLARVNGTLVGYAFTHWRVDDDGTYLHFVRHHVHPDWRGRGLETELLDFLERRAGAIAAGHPAGAPRFLTGFAADTETARRALLEQAGHVPTRYFYTMRRHTLDDIPEAPLPDGLELRPVRPEHYRAIMDALSEAFRDHWSNITPGDDDYAAWLKMPYFDPDLWRVAWDGDQIAGASINVINTDENAHFGRLEGWVDDLAVRRPWRRRGLGRALLVASLHAFRGRGMTSAGLGVDTENLTGALRVYEGVGFEAVKRFTAYRKALV